MSELKPCPFCGGEAHLRIYANGEANIDVDHLDGCWLPEFENYYDFEGDDVQAVVKAWNRRVDA